VRPGAARRRLLHAAGAFTTPLLPDDYLGMVNPLWSRELRGRVLAVTPETRDSATLVIRPGPAWAGHRAGQYVRVGVEVGGVREHRSYSLTSVPRAPDGCIAVTVKAVAGGGVSSHLVHRIAPGAVVRLDQATGAFVLPEPAPTRLLFVTAGSGITPVMGMLRAARTLRDVVVVHADRTPDDVIFGAELRATRGVRLHEHHSAHQGRLTFEAVARLVPDWAERETFACGPAGLLDALEARFAAAGVRSRLRVERFRAVLPPGALEGAGGRVTFTRSGRDTEVDGATSLLDAGERVGALLPSGCRMGDCRTCVGRLREGLVRDLRTGVLHGTPGDLVQTCVSAPAGPVAIEL